MIDWLLDKVPIWLWLCLATAAVITLWRIAGLRAALAVLAVIITGGAYRAGRQSGSADALARQKKINEKAVKHHADIKAETDRMSDDDLDAANDPWLRKPGRGR